VTVLEGVAANGLEGSPARSLVWSSRTLAVLAGTAVLLAALVFRVWGIDAVGYNSDEAVYAGQAAGIAGIAEIRPFFPVFRAHPMLFQTALSVLFVNGVSDVAGRLLGVAFGVATVGLVLALGSLLYNRTVGLLAAAFLAVMPYHVVVTRQALLDGPATFFSTLVVLLVAKYVKSGQPAWLYAVGAGLGLAFLSKETMVILVAALYAFFVLNRDIHVRFRHLVGATAVFAVVAAPFPASMLLAGRSDTGRNFLAWQLFRRPNHPVDFYFRTLPPSFGWLVLALAAVALVALARRRGGLAWQELLLCSWIFVPLAFFSLWPVKGYHYLLGLAPMLAILAAVGLLQVVARVRSARRPEVESVVGVAVLLVVLATLAAATVSRITPSSSGTFLAGSGGVPGGREAGHWVLEHVPEGAEMLALGPSMANIIQFYGHRKTYGLSVSLNPLHRNPTYEPVRNPDLKIRRNELQYVVWDSYSAGRSPFFSERLLRYAERYHGRVVHTEYVEVRTADGAVVPKPVIVIYEVRP
jgi:hypothetical protein